MLKQIIKRIIASGLFLSMIAIIKLPDGTIVKGPVTGKVGYNMLQGSIVEVVIEGKKYITHFSNVVTIEEKNKK